MGTLTKWLAIVVTILWLATSPVTLIALVGLAVCAWYKAGSSK